MNIKLRRNSTDDIISINQIKSIEGHTRLKKNWPKTGIQSINNSAESPIGLKKLTVILHFFEKKFL